jgi:hypothetical protein
VGGRKLCGLAEVAIISNFFLGGVDNSVLWLSFAQKKEMKNGCEIVLFQSHEKIVRNKLMRWIGETTIKINRKIYQSLRRQIDIFNNRVTRSETRNLDSNDKRLKIF